MSKILLLFLLSVNIFAKDIVILVEAMHCPLCTVLVRKELLKVDGVEKVKAKLVSKKAYVTANDSVDENKLLKAIEKIKYPGIIVKE
ncbi:heavy-metal-associated domain-containing protein [Campylobacter pinnipediorum]|uniref:heavy-metal-associated domain-containing protein n=1 Tax=Campylobacter pinnipediorum TaxID=1965231 RepID=UPI00084D7BC6|nr:heavy metal-associated domain-containing protein [Campylobacter pinnipediorum]